MQKISNFLGSKNFKLLFVFVLFISILTPQIAQGNFLEVCSPQQWLTFPMTTFQCALQWLLTALLKLVLIIILVVAWIPVSFFSTILALLISLLASSLGPLLAVPVLGSQMVTNMWVFVRDFANLFFILFFVLIGLSTILKIETYKFQKTLPLLIVMALLTNFSLVFVGLVVDIGNILTSIFLGAVHGKASAFGSILNLSQGVLENSVSTVWNSSWSGWGMGAIAAFVGMVTYYMGILFVYVTIFFVLFTIFFIFIYRIAILWILAILSPLAFVSYIFETTRKAVWQRWLSALVKWSIVAVPILFFMFIGLYILHSAPAEIQQITQGLPAGGPGAMGQMSRLIHAAIVPLLSAIIMLIGVIISMTVLPEAAESAISLAKQSPSIASGIFQAGAKRVPFINKATAGYMRMMESIGAAPLGSYQQKNKNERDEAYKRSSQVRTEEIINKLNSPLTKLAEKVAYMDVLKERGDLTPQLYKDNINNYVLGGGRKKDILSGVSLEADNRKDRIEATNLATKDGKSLAMHDKSIFDNSIPGITMEQHWQQVQAGTALVDRIKTTKDFYREASPEKIKAAYDYLGDTNRQSDIISELVMRGDTAANAQKKIDKAMMQLSTH